MPIGVPGGSIARPNREGPCHVHALGRFSGPSSMPSRSSASRGTCRFAGFAGPRADRHSRAH
eukprot:4471418-Alexandrium_andersonii.AAC.1